MLKSRTKFPPGGWKFLQPQTGWKPPGGFNFDTTVGLIIKHRQSNSRFALPTSFDEVANELEAYTEKRLRAMRGAEKYYFDAGGDLPKKVQTPVRRSAVAGVAGSIKRTSAGVRTLLDWLGTGAKPVDSQLAVSRAAICANCQKNSKGSLYQWIQSRLAGEFQSLLGIAKDLKLSTPYDDKLEVCQACDCHLPLKVWVPLSHINKTTSEEVRSSLDPGCWIIKES